MINKKFVLLLIIILVVMVLAGNVSAKGNLKIIAAHNQTSPENPYQIGMLKFKEVAEELSDGGIKVEVYAGTLGTSESELVEMLKLQAVDIILVSPGFMTKTGIGEIQLFALPYLFDNYQHWEKVVDGQVGEEMAEIINEKSHNDFKLIGYWSAGVRHFYGKKPLHSIADLAGIKIRTQTSGVVANFWEKTDAIPTSVAWGELYQALQQNVVDAAENAYPYFVQQNHHKTANGKYITETGHDYTTRFLLMNGHKFDSLTKEQQDIIMKAAEACVETEREELYKQEEEYKQIAINEGAAVNKINRGFLIELAKPLQDDTAEEIGVKDLLKQVRGLK